MMPEIGCFKKNKNGYIEKAEGGKIKKERICILSSLKHTTNYST